MIDQRQWSTADAQAQIVHEPLDDVVHYRTCRRAALRGLLRSLREHNCGSEDLGGLLAVEVAEPDGADTLNEVVVHNGPRGDAGLDDVEEVGADYVCAVR